MTAKECIIARCKDCVGRGVCEMTGCQLYGLKNASSGCNRPKAIRDYCRWCRRDLPVWVCSSPKCPIYAYLGYTTESTGVSVGMDGEMIPEEE